MRIYAALFFGLMLVTVLFLSFGHPSLYEADEELKTAIATNDSRILYEALEHGADINIVYWNGLTPLAFASARGHLGLVKILLDEGANIDLLTKYNQTVVMVALVFSHNDVVELLLERGADPEGMDKNGQTALDYAEENKNAIGIKLLKRYLRR